MFTLDTSEPGFVRVHSTGRLAARDYDALERELETELKRRGGRAPLLLDLRGWKGWTPGGFLRDLRFDLRHRRSFPRIAVVGDRPWHKWLTIAGRPLFTGEMRYFEAEQETEAVAWVSTSP